MFYLPRVTKVINGGPFWALFGRLHIAQQAKLVNFWSRRFRQKSKFCHKENENFVKTRNLGQKSRFGQKSKCCHNKNENFVKNRNLGQKSELCHKENENFPKNRNLDKNRD